MHQEIRTGQALAVLLFLVASMAVFCLLLKTGPQLPLLVSCCVVAVSARRSGYTWRETLGAMLGGIGQSLEAIVILLLVGVLMAVWIACGTVPAMMAYGLRLMHPRFFYAAAFLLTAVASMALGSWGAAGTVGLAILGIGSALSLPAPITAGAVISGAYVGDKTSPLTDCLNLAAAVSKCDARTILRRLLPILWRVLAVTAALFLAAGLFRSGGEPRAMQEKRDALIAALDGRFAVGPLQLLPLALMLGCSAAGMPAIPALAAGIVSGAVLALAGGRCSAAELVHYSYAGAAGGTGLGELDAILSGGGLRSMLYTVSLAASTLAFGGAVTRTGHAEPLVEPILRRIRSPFGMVGLTVALGVCVNMLLPDQYLSIALTGRLLAGRCREKGVDEALFANAVSAAAVTSALIPWNSCGVYMTSVLGVATAEYLPWCWFNFLMPAAMLLHALRLSRAGKKRASAAPF